MPTGVYPRVSKIRRVVDGVRYKRCSRCRDWHILENFQKCKTFKDGLANHCKGCSKILDAAKYIKRRGAVSKRNKEYYRENKTRILQRNGEYFEIHKEEINLYKSNWQKENREKRRLRLNERYKTEPNFRIAVTLRTRILKAIENNQKAGSTLELLGCSVDFFKVHLEFLFSHGMSWQNHGTVWHIDHIKPCASFDLSNDDEQRKCFHYSNMQPLFIADNLKKGTKTNWANPSP